MLCVGGYKDETEFKFDKKRGKYRAYCSNCQRLYNKEYLRIYRERKRREKEERENDNKKSE